MDPSRAEHSIVTRYRLIQGDCIAVMGGMPSRSVDLILADPPYLTDYSPRDGRKVAGDSGPDWLLPAFAQAYRVLKPDSFCVTFYGWPHADLFLSAWRRAGFSPVSHLVCLKRYSSKRGYTLGCHETLYLLAKGRPALPPAPGKDVLQWSYTGNAHHPTQKPVGTIRELIERFSKPDDVVLDPEAICFAVARNRLCGGPLSIED